MRDAEVQMAAMVREPHELQGANAMNTHRDFAFSGSAITARNVNLGHCGREQVQYPGAIQPHGALLVLKEPELDVLQARANLALVQGNEELEAFAHTAAHDLKQALGGIHPRRGRHLLFSLPRKL